MSFNPKPNQKIVINQIEYKFSPLPSIPRIVWGASGGRATVYHLESTSKSKAISAFKVFYPNFRLEQNALKAEEFFDYSLLPGLEVCARHVVVPDDNHKELLKEHPDLKYSVLMRWMPGVDWASIISARDAIESTKLYSGANQFVEIMANLEKKSISHCDISGGNVLIDFDNNEIYLVDVEDIYAPDLEPPKTLTMGTPGYNHKEYQQNGYWGPLGDRFAGAVIIAEMLGWVDESIRKGAFERAYFDENEMQTDCKRYQNLHRVLVKNYGKTCGALFKRAWFSKTLEECPSFDEWNLWFEGKREYEPLNAFDHILLGTIKMIQDVGGGDHSLKLYKSDLNFPLNILSDDFRIHLAKNLIKEGIQWEKTNYDSNQTYLTEELECLPKYLHALALITDKRTDRVLDESLYQDLIQMLKKIDWEDNSLSIEIIQNSFKDDSIIYSILMREFNNRKDTVVNEFLAKSVSNGGGNGN